jgi:hypothetical protein
LGMAKIHVTGDSLRISKYAETLSVLPKSRRPVNSGGIRWNRAGLYKEKNNGGSIWGNLNDRRCFVRD